METTPAATALACPLHKQERDSSPQPTRDTAARSLFSSTHADD